MKKWGVCRWMRCGNFERQKEDKGEKYEKVDTIIRAGCGGHGHCGGRAGSEYHDERFGYAGDPRPKVGGGLHAKEPGHEGPGERRRLRHGLCSVAKPANGPGECVTPD